MNINCELWYIAKKNNMNYPKNLENVNEALITLAEFAKTAPGHLPERVEIAINIAKNLQVRFNCADKLTDIRT
jgi:hypothetical protein